MSTETLTRDVNELITFYEQYKPDAGRNGIRVHATPKDLARALDLPFDPAEGKTHFNYRGRIVIAIGPHAQPQEIRK